MRPYLAAEHPLRFAHRGSRVLWPENTMPAFQGAIDLGYRYLETDVRASADGVLYAFHDRTLERVTSGLGPIAEWRSDELDRLDAAFFFDPAHDYPRRGEGVRLPRLEEVMAAFPHAHVNVDVKAAETVPLLARFVLDRGLEERVLVGSFFDARIRAFRKLTGGRVVTSAGPLEVAACWLASRLGRGLATPADALQLPARTGGREVVDARLVRAAHAAGKQVHVWTVDDPGRMRHFLDLGADGIITDRPDVLAEVVAARPTDSEQ